MTQLYYCNAKCDEQTLVSYHTLLIKFYFDPDTNSTECYGNRFPSSTSAQHLRKYVHWLEENGYYENAILLNYALNTAIAKHIRYFKATYNAHTGELKFEEDK
jgi:hypothetical protein